MEKWKIINLTFKDMWFYRQLGNEKEGSNIKQAKTCVQVNSEEPWDPFGLLCPQIARNKKKVTRNSIQWRNVYTKFHENRSTPSKFCLRKDCFFCFFLIYFVDRASRHRLLLITNSMHFFMYLFIYFISLHVSSITVLIIRRSNCINASGMISLCKWLLGIPVRHTKQSLTQTNQTRWRINTIRSPDDEHCDARNM
jgi:hypothetical protein